MYYYLIIKQIKIFFIIIKLSLVIRFFNFVKYLWPLKGFYIRDLGLLGRLYLCSHFLSSFLNYVFSVLMLASLGFPFDSDYASLLIDDLEGRGEACAWWGFLLLKFNYLPIRVGSEFSSGILLAPWCHHVQSLSTTAYPILSIGGTWTKGLVDDTPYQVMWSSNRWVDSWFFFFGGRNIDSVLELKPNKIRTRQVDDEDEMETTSVVEQWLLVDDEVN